MLVIFDKKRDPHIVSIISGDDTTGLPFIATQYFWTSESGNSLVIDEDTYRIRCGNDDVVVKFDSYEAMKPYIDQLYIIFVRIARPGVDGVMTDIYYDKPKTGGIVPHDYTFTDIEKTLLSK